MKTKTLALFIIFLLAVATSMPILAAAKPSNVKLVVFELRADGKPDGTPGGKPVKPPPPQPIDPEENDHYELLGFSFSTTADYWINPNNAYGFTATEVEYAITSSAETWDSVVTSVDVFSYAGQTERASGKLDGFNVIDWGRYRNGVIAVTMIWTYTATGDIAEVDMKLNIRYAWSLAGESDKMDVQNIVTHEFGHWAGLADLYSSADYWLTMYGYSGYGITYQRTLGLGDRLGIQDVYGL